MTLSGTIINAFVIPMGPRPELIQSGYVTVKDGVISEFGQGAPRQAEPGWFIDAHGSVLMPCLTDSDVLSCGTEDFERERRSWPAQLSLFL